jgi:hypothetical protein
LTGTPCRDAANKNDPTKNDIVLTVYPGTDMTFDVVFDQRGGAGRAEIGVFKNKIKYPADILADPASCIEGTDGAPNGTTCTKPVCTADPSKLFNFDACDVEGVICCSQAFTNTYGLGAGIYIWNSDVALAAGTTDNFVSDKIQFKALSAANVGATYTLQFDMFDADNNTDGTFIGVGIDSCPALSSDDCQNTDGNPFPKQAAMTTYLHVEVVPCYTGKPGSATLTCKGTPPGCTPTSGAATAKLTYTRPTNCYKEDGTTIETPACTDLGIQFISTQINGDATPKKLWAADANPYEVALPTAVGTTISPFDVVGVSGGASGATKTCSPSDGKSVGNLGKITVAATPCTCGNPPTIALNPSKEAVITSKTFFDNQPAVITAKVTVDSSLTLPGAIPAEGLKLYYTNNPAASLYQSLDVRPTLQSDGTFTATIPGTYVVADQPVYFCLVARDTNTAEGKWPAACDTTSVATLVSTSEVIPGANIIKGTRFTFVEGLEPYPNQFPFQPTPEVPLRIYFTLNDAAEVTAQIFSLDGTLIRVLPYDSTNPFSSCSSSNPDKCNMCTQASSDQWQKGCIWDGTTYEGGSSFVSNGMYIINIHAVCTGSAFRGSSFDYTKGIVVMK